MLRYILGNLRTPNRRLLSSAVLASAGLLLAGCPLNPKAQVRNERNQTGGWLHVSGQGFTHNGSVRLSVLNAPGRTAPLSIGSTNADASGNFNDYVFQYTWRGGGVLPGCVYGSGDSVTISVVASDQTTSSFATVTVSVINCEW